MKKLTVCLSMVLLLMVFAVPIQAANTKDTYYLKSSISSSGNWISTVFRVKENVSWVYAKPSRCPSGISRMKVITRKNDGKTLVYNTYKGEVRLSNGVAYGIRNNVIEMWNAPRNTALLMKPLSGSGVMDGVWSPDSVGSPGHGFTQV